MSDPTGSTSGSEAMAHIQDSVKSGKLIAVVGTGVSLALTNGKNPELSWKGLIEGGFEYGTTKAKITDEQKQSWKHQLNSDDIDEVLGAAEFMGRKLGAPHGDLYGRWLERVFKDANPEKNEMANAVRALQSAGTRKIRRQSFSSVSSYDLVYLWRQDIS
jgi:hypothetical protein